MPSTVGHECAPNAKPWPPSPTFSHSASRCGAGTLPAVSRLRTPDVVEPGVSSFSTGQWWGRRRPRVAGKHCCPATADVPLNERCCEMLRRAIRERFPATPTVTIGCGEEWVSLFSSAAGSAGATSGVRRLVSALLRCGENLSAHRPLIHMPQFRRRLPHRYPRGKWLFVTRHLHGSLPQAMYPPPRKPSSGSAFVWMDRYLDSARSGPVYLAQEPIAAMVDSSLRRGVLLGQYELGAYAIMANHVHALLLPKVSPSRLLQSLKGATARQANLLLRRTGERFWQAE